MSETEIIDESNGEVVKVSSSGFEHTKAQVLTSSANLDIVVTLSVKKNCREEAVRLVAALRKLGVNVHDPYNKASE